MDFKSVGLAGLLAFAGAGPVLAADQDFKDWWAACDNTRRCTAFGFTPEDSEDRAYLILERGAEPDAAPTIQLRAGVDETSWTLAVDGEPVPGLGAVKAKDDSDYLRATLTTTQSAALAQAIVNGSRLDIMSEGSRVSGISLAGSAAALRWMDDQQRRAGATNALAAKGTKPAASIPAAPPPPLVRAAAPVPQGKIASEPPASVRAFTKDCEDDIGDMRGKPLTGRLAADVYLWAPLCSRGAYNLIYEFVLTDAKGGQPRSAQIRYPSGQIVSQLMNVGYDPKTQGLSNFEKGRGLGDCGAQNAWVWDGSAFVPVSQSMMGVCRGVTPDDWPVTYRSRSK